MYLDCLTFEELEKTICDAGLPKFRAGQIYRWISRGVQTFSEMSDLSKELREQLSATFSLTQLNIHKKFRSKLDQTTKYLIMLEDGNIVECVAMYYKHGISICISTQVGCLMGCRFCASTLGGKMRNLTPAELLGQIILVQNDLGERISNIVLMGIGEPLDNYNSVIIFLKNVNNPKGIGIGYRHISLSTCGLVDKIDQLAKEAIPLTLSISLHAPNDEIRNKIMPVNARYPVKALMESCRNYLRQTGRRISFEYILIDGLNDTPQCAIELSRLLKGMLCHINLIPANFVSECGFTASSDKKIRDFSNLLLQNGMNATVRRELGSDISASCGQLRKGELNGNKRDYECREGSQK